MYSPDRFKCVMQTMHGPFWKTYFGVAGTYKSYSGKGQCSPTMEKKKQKKQIQDVAPNCIDT